MNEARATSEGAWRGPMLHGRIARVGRHSFVACVGLAVVVSGFAAAGRGRPETGTPPGVASPDPLALALDDRVTFDSERSETLGAAALELVAYDWQGALPGWQVQFVRGDSNVAGYTWSNEQRIEVFVRPSADAPALARILAHELGHAVDVTLNSPEERTRWVDVRGLAPETPWWPSSGAADFQTGAGDFAEVFAVWQVGPSDFRSEVGPLPDHDDLALLETLADAG